MDRLRHRATRRALRLEAMEPRLFLSAGSPDSIDWTGLAQVRTDYGLTGQGQTVAVIDSGITYSHAALGGGFGTGYRVVGGYDFAEQDDDPADDGPRGAHGTHVAGIIAGDDPNSLGVAPGVDLVALRVFDDQGAGSLGRVEQALQWVHANRDAFRYPITTVNLSLGAVGNFQATPEWAFLEDDLAQLAADGIFISVAAGNAFTTYGATGVEYPAVSSHVTPVAAAAQDGTMAQFSQRDTRCLVAPGVGLLGTLPDRIGNHNGIDDDFGRCSGTSVAAAYVAGAGMLLREACLKAGMDDVSGTQLYQILLNTADTIHDTATGLDYSRLNLARAVASVSKTSAIDAQTPPSTIDWGTTAQGRFDGYRIDSGGLRFSLTAANDALLTIEAFADDGPQGVRLELLDASGRQVAASQNGTATARIDIPTGAGSTFTLLVTGEGSAADGQVDFRVTNLVARAGRTVRVVGTPAADQFTFAADASMRLSINGVAYDWSREEVAAVVFEGLGGQDAASLIGSASSETAIIRSDSTTLTGPGYSARLIGVPSVSLDGGGGDDSAALYVNGGDQRLEAAGRSVKFSNQSAEIALVGFSRVRIPATAARSRTARLAALDLVLQLEGRWRTTIT